MAAQGQPQGHLILNHRLADPQGGQHDLRLGNRLALQVTREQRQGGVAPDRRRLNF